MEKIKYALVTLVFCVACGQKSSDLYGDLGESDDGVIDAEIPAEDIDPNTSAKVSVDELVPQEKAIVDSKFGARYQAFNFVIVEADTMNVMRSYHASTPARLASVTKIATAITALDHISGISYDKVRSMLKRSTNGEASRYLRLTVKNMFGYLVPGNGYTDQSSCPANAVAQEADAATMILDHMMSKVNADWTGAALKDGAGCNYGNVMTPLQIAAILNYADVQGTSYGGQRFETFLSISGVDGTWKSRNTDARGRVLAKTGTLNVAANLAGYFYAKRGGELHKYYFAMLVTKQNSGEATRARAFIESMVRYWVNYYSTMRGEPVNP